MMSSTDGAGEGSWDSKDTWSLMSTSRVVTTNLLH